MTGRPRPEARKVADAKTVANLYLRGRKYREIEELTGLGRGTIADHVQALLGEWREDAIRDIGLAKELELAKINQLEVAYWNAWDLSTKKHTVETIKSRPIPAPATEREPLQLDGVPLNTRRAQPVRQDELILERLVKTEKTEGNPQWLIGIQWCINKRCEILGLNAPREAHLAGPGGGPLNISQQIDLSNLTSEQLELLEMLWTTTAPKSNVIGTDLLDSKDRD